MNYKTQIWISGISILITFFSLLYLFNRVYNYNDKVDEDFKTISAALDTIADKPRQLLNCIKSVDGTDAECDSCYYMIYGEFPKSK